jgi:hypothetical protein
MKTRAFLLFSLLALASGACGSSAEQADTSQDALEADSAPDAVYVANARTFFEALLNEGTNRDTARIPYSEMPERLAKALERNNPDPKREWADEAYRAKVKNARGHLVLVYAIVGGIDDEGEDITLYTPSARQFADGNDYRGFEWTQ